MKKQIVAMTLATCLGTSLFTQAHADEPMITSFGGQKFCNQIITDSSTNETYGLMWSGWILGYWSGINAMQTEGTVGASFLKNEDYGEPIIVAVFEKCEKNRNMLLQKAVNDVYFEMEGAGK